MWKYNRAARALVHFLFALFKNNVKLPLARSGQQNGALSNEATKTAIRTRQIYMFNNVYQFKKNENSNFARFARAFLIFVHFATILVLSMA